jgi:hypothetical protein
MTNATREALARDAEADRRHGQRINPAKWILDNGRDFERSLLPKGVRLATPKHCYEMLFISY